MPEVASNATGRVATRRGGLGAAQRASHRVSLGAPLGRRPPRRLRGASVPRARRRWSSAVSWSACCRVVGPVAQRRERREVTLVRVASSSAASARRASIATAASSTASGSRRRLDGKRERRGRRRFLGGAAAADQHQLDAVVAGDRPGAVARPGRRLGRGRAELRPDAAAGWCSRSASDHVHGQSATPPPRQSSEARTAADRSAGSPGTGPAQPAGRGRRARTARAPSRCGCGPLAPLEVAERRAVRARRGRRGRSSGARITQSDRDEQRERGERGQQLDPCAAQALWASRNACIAAALS